MEKGKSTVPMHSSVELLVQLIFDEVGLISTLLKPPHISLKKSDLIKLQEAPVLINVDPLAQLNLQ